MILQNKGKEMIIDQANVAGWILRQGGFVCIAERLFAKN